LLNVNLHRHFSTPTRQRAVLTIEQATLFFCQNYIWDISTANLILLFLQWHTLLRFLLHLCSYFGKKKFVFHLWNIKSTYPARSYKFWAAVSIWPRNASIATCVNNFVQQTVECSLFVQRPCHHRLVNGRIIDAPLWNITLIIFEPGCPVVIVVIPFFCISEF